MGSPNAMIALDSNTMTYFIDALSSIDGAPREPLSVEKIALARIYFWSEDFCYRVTPTVEREYGAIRQQVKQDIHRSFAMTLISGVRPLPQVPLVERRALQLSALHPDANDRRIVAECELCEIETLLTCDARLEKNLRASAHGVVICKPSEHWEAMSVRPGTKPQSIPHASNPLSSASWWQLSDT